MTYYYISWHGECSVFTRCFDTAEEREIFRRRVDYKRAKVQTWERTF